MKTIEHLKWMNLSFKRKLAGCGVFGSLFLSPFKKMIPI
jgi:hypothetical protein